MKLNVLERLLALSVLPEEGDFVTLKVIRRGKMELSFSEDELKKYKVKNVEVETPDGKKQNTQWDSSVEQETEIKLGSKVISLVSEGLEKLNKDKKLKEEHYTLYEKFCKEDN